MLLESYGISLTLLDRWGSEGPCQQHKEIPVLLSTEAKKNLYSTLADFHRRRILEERQTRLQSKPYSLLV